MTSLLSPSVVLVDVDEHIEPAELARVAKALTRQIAEHFAPAWGLTATVRAATSSTPPRPLEWQIQLRKVPTIEGALGYHDRTPTGQPIAYVFPELCKQDGSSWSSCASHELTEMLADPGLHRCAELPDGRVACVEVADQVEGDVYKIDGVEVSNFNLPDNFEPPAHATPGTKYDYLGKQTKPFEVRPGGYAQVYDPHKGWTQLGEMSIYRQKLASLGLSRGARRRRHAEPRA